MKSSLAARIASSLSCALLCASSHAALHATTPAAVAGARAATQDVKATGKKALKAGLAWLARHQSDDGSWSSKKLEGVCTPGERCWHLGFEASDHYDVGLTGLALLSFVRAGYTPSAQDELLDPVTGKRFKPGDVVARATSWLCKLQKKDGSFTPERSFLYNEAIATLALAEWHAAEKSDVSQSAVERAAGFLVAAQRPSPKGDGL